MTTEVDPGAEVTEVAVTAQNSAVVTLKGANQTALRSARAKQAAIVAAAGYGVSRPGFSGWGDLRYVTADGRVITDDNAIADLARSGVRYTCEQDVNVRGGL